MKLSKMSWPTWTNEYEIILLLLWAFLKWFFCEHMCKSCKIAMVSNKKNSWYFFMVAYLKCYVLFDWVFLCMKIKSVLLRTDEYYFFSHLFLLWRCLFYYRLCLRPQDSLQHLLLMRWNFKSFAWTSPAPLWNLERELMDPFRSLSGAKIIWKSHLLCT